MKADEEVVALFPRHCEERSDAAIHCATKHKSWIATLRSR
jgi:hypothetical protein